MELDSVDVFEIVDFTLVSDWERLIASLEQLLLSGSRQGDFEWARKRHRLERVGDGVAADPAMEMMDSPNDFNPNQDLISRWFGLSSYVTVTSYDDCTDLEDATMLLSTLCVALDNARLRGLPVFVPYRNRAIDQSKDLLGYLCNSTSYTRFACRTARAPLRDHIDLRWLVEAFGVRVGDANLDLSVAIHARWKHSINPQGGWQPPAGQAGRRHTETSWGPDRDPVTRLALATTTQLTLLGGRADLAGLRASAAPEECAHWALQVRLDATMDTPLSDSARALCECIRDAEGFTSVRQAAEHRPLMETLTRSLLDAVSVLPTPEEINLMITRLFDVHHPAALYIPHVDFLLEVKSAPPLTLLSSLCMYLLNVEGLTSVCMVWREFVKELRWHWDHFELLPRTPFDTPGHCFSKLYQQLQMLNWCIEQRRQHNDRATSSSSSRAALGGWSDTEWAEQDEEDHDQEDTDLTQQMEEKPLGTEHREGMARELPMKLLVTGKVMCQPLTQDASFVTEDMMDEQQQLLMSLGADEQGSQQRSEMQSRSLLSDMEAFKAANPECVLEDFVRWHSDKDWVVASEPNGSDLEGKQTDGSWVYLDQHGTRLRGTLSVRMKDPANLWHQKWREARPRSAATQKPLIDHVREGERILHALETAEPRALVQQCALVALTSVHYTLGQLPVAGLPSVQRQLASLGAALLEAGPYADPEDLEPALAQLKEAERLCASSTSLLHKLRGAADLVEQLMGAEGSAPVDDEVRGVVAEWFFAGADECLPAPLVREYLLRQVTGPHRLYAKVKDTWVRLAYAISAVNDEE